MSIKVGHSTENKEELREQFLDCFGISLDFESESSDSHDPRAEDSRYEGTAYELTAEILDSASLQESFRRVVESHGINKVLIHCRTDQRNRCLFCEPELRTIHIYRTNRQKLLETELREAYVKRQLRDLAT